ncbi:MAG: guanylate kinase [Oligoflexales bacterium]|nr:guanylate kinase [Oligoflexales bacterium]
MAKWKDIYVIAAPSGTGKTTLNRRLVKELPDFEVSISLTTRHRRENETHGVHYWFVDESEFKKRIADGSMLEWAEVHGNLYGTTLDEMDRIRLKKHAAILEIDVQGWASVRPLLPKEHSCSVFILPPTMNSLWERLNLRGTDSLSVQEKRLRSAYEELRSAAFFDHFIVNDDLEKAYAELKALVQYGKPSSMTHEEGVEHSQKLLKEFETHSYLRKIS